MRRRLFLKRRIGKFYRLLRTRDEYRRLILIYHSVGDSGLATPIEVFRNHLKLIASTGHLVTLRDLVEGPPERKLSVSLTFDDGYCTLRDRAAPILMDFGASATAFLNVGEIGDGERSASRPEAGYYANERFLTWRDIDVLKNLGWDFGSHGVHHFDLVDADNFTILRELSASKEMLERRLGKPCDLFAYPWGRSTAHVRAKVREAGYRYGFAGGHSALPPDLDPMAVPRINVAREYSSADLAAILRGDWDYLDWIVKVRTARK